MCGRYDNTKIKEELEKEYNKALVSEEGREYHPNFNAAPTQYMPVITSAKPEVIQLFHWGLIPVYSKIGKMEFSTLNAKKETLKESRLWSPLLKKKRCLVPATGFIEWHKLDSKNKQPYRFQTSDRELFSMAGLFEQWASRETGEIINSFTIITTEPNMVVKFAHDRMPVILSKEAETLWVDQSQDIDFLYNEVLNSYPAHLTVKYPIQKAIGSVANNQFDLLSPLV